MKKTLLSFRFPHKTRLLNALLFLIFGAAVWAGDAKGVIDLSGTWKVRLDPENIGEKEHWQRQDFEQTCRLPGSLTTNTIGNDIGLDTPWVATEEYATEITALMKEYASIGKNLTPSWLRPQKHYIGSAWYQREIKLPFGKPALWVLRLERTHWKTTVWVDETCLGSNDALFVPHEYRFSGSGQRRITIRVDNSMIYDIGKDSHANSDQTQGTWNGIIGKMTVAAAPAVALETLRWGGRFAEKQLRLTGKLANPYGVGMDGGELAVTLVDKRTRKPVVSRRVPLSECLFEDGRIELTVDVPETVKAWDEFDPTLYLATAQLCDGETVLDQQDAQIGFRDICVDGQRFMINGRPLFIRSTLECCSFPLTGFPPTDVKSWKKLYAKIQSYGCNAVRFHSYTPPEAAFTAADELGVYLQPEMAWAHAVGEGKSVDDWLYQEGVRILDAYGSHPSFVFFAAGNEFGGPSVGQAASSPELTILPDKHPRLLRKLAGLPASQYLCQWVPYFKQLTDLQLITGSSGWPYIGENDFHIYHEPLRLLKIYETVGPRSDWDYGSVVEHYQTPLIAHEIGQWSAFPSLDIEKKYKGIFEQDMLDIIRYKLKANGIYDQHREFTQATGRTQLLFFKESVEAMLRTPKLGGYQLLSLQEFTGQGTAICGMLDPFWDEKGYCTAREFTTFNHVTVPLAMMAKRVWLNDEAFTAEIRLAHYGQEALAAGQWQWNLKTSGGDIMDSGKIVTERLNNGDVYTIGHIDTSLSSCQKAQKLTLEVMNHSLDIENSWNIWVYPKKLQEPEANEPWIVNELSGKVIERLAKGETVIFSPKLEHIKKTRQSFFEPIFWRSEDVPIAPEGLLIQHKHPALKDFPCDYYKDMQWWEPVKHSVVANLSGLSEKLRPIIQVVDNIRYCERLGYVFEVRCGGGNLIFSAIDLIEDIDSRPVSRQLRYSLIHYVHRGDCRPKVAVTLDDIRSLLNVASEEQ